jgi:hypothetical protein
MEERENQPAKRFSIGRVEAAIWENGNDTNVWHQVSFTRWYRDGEQSKNSTNFRVEDLPLVERLNQMAFRWILERQGTLRGEVNGNGKKKGR